MSILIYLNHVEPNHISPLALLSDKFKHICHILNFSIISCWQYEYWLYFIRLHFPKLFCIFFSQITADKFLFKDITWSRTHHYLVTLRASVGDSIFFASLSVFGDFSLTLYKHLTVHSIKKGRNSITHVFKKHGAHYKALRVKTDIQIFEKACDFDSSTKHNNITQKCNFWVIRPSLAVFHVLVVI